MPSRPKSAPQGRRGAHYRESLNCRQRQSAKKFLLERDSGEFTLADLGHDKPALFEAFIGDLFAVQFDRPLLNHAKAFSDVLLVNPACFSSAAIPIRPVIHQPASVVSGISSGIAPF